jgi:hypothetical protein
MLVRLLRSFPDLPEAGDIRKALDANLSAENILVETAYLKQKNRQSFERTYGWAWLLKLAEELSLSNDDDAKTWSRNLRPLVDALVNSYVQFLPKQTYPIRTGVHPNTAFGLAFAFDYAKTSGNKKLAALIAERSRTYFANDRNYPGAWEPGGEDFFSPALLEADLMRRVLGPAEFRQWFDRFLPQLGAGIPKTLLQPATVTDRSDPKLVHLDGLNLSRAWCMRSIANALPPTDPARRVLVKSARIHLSDALAHVASGDYAGEHWLASFAVYLLSTPEPRTPKRSSDCWDRGRPARKRAEGAQSLRRSSQFIFALRAHLRAGRLRSQQSLELYPRPLAVGSSVAIKSISC